MVEIILREDSRGRLSSFSASGHAGWDTSGEDIVCAAVSTLLQSAWFGLVEVASIEVTASRSPGKLDVAWPVSARDDIAARAIVETATRSAERIAVQYPDNVRVIRVKSDG